MDSPINNLVSAIEREIIHSECPQLILVPELEHDQVGLVDERSLDSSENYPRTEAIYAVFAHPAIVAKARSVFPTATDGEIALALAETIRRKIGGE